MILKKLIKPVFIHLIEYHDKVRKNKIEYVFILSHMRSGSTLLNHILMSHPEILGCGESNAYYDKAKDLAKLRLRTYVYHKHLFKPHRYVVDQINHNKFIRDVNFVNHPRIKKIFLIREPEASISSMVEVLGRFYGTTLSQAINHYLDRISGLSEFVINLKEKKSAVFLTYSQLVEKPDTILMSLKDFLDLQTNLSAKYSIFSFTGKRGDPGSTIQLGCICKERNSHQIQIPPNEKDRVKSEYRRCLSIMRANIASVDRFNIV